MDKCKEGEFPHRRIVREYAVGASVWILVWIVAPERFS